MREIVPGQLFTVYTGKTTYSLYRANYAQPFQYVVPMTIPPNTSSLTINAQTSSIPGSLNNAQNPLYMVYNLPAYYSDFLLFGLNWNSPYVELTAVDPSGTPFWQLGPALTTKAYQGDRVYGVTALFGASSNLAPSITVQRRIGSTLTPYPVNQPLPFTLYWFGYLIKYEVVKQDISMAEMPGKPEEVYEPIVYLYSPFPEIYGR
ncbi:MAG: hypothetical protein QXV17_04610 [Candidatus Micrarchaeaceae archaeon]